MAKGAERFVSLSDSPFFRRMASRLRGVFSIHTEVEEDAGSEGAVDGLLSQRLLLLKLLSGGRGRCCELLVLSAMLQSY